MEKETNGIARRDFLGNISKAGILSALGTIGATLPLSSAAAILQSLTAEPLGGRVFFTKPTCSCQTQIA